MPEPNPFDAVRSQAAGGVGGVLPARVSALAWRAAPWVTTAANTKHTKLKTRQTRVAMAIQNLPSSTKIKTITSATPNIPAGPGPQPAA